jgi:hypothetical protein
MLQCKRPQSAATTLPLACVLLENASAGSGGKVCIGADGKPLRCQALLWTHKRGTGHFCRQGTETLWSVLRDGPHAAHVCHELTSRFECPKSCQGVLAREGAH